MSTNLIRTLTNKCIVGVKNFGISQRRLGSTFKAAVLKEVGKPLVIEELKPKKLDKKQVRIQVHYCSVNSNDVESFKLPNLKLPFIPGYELSGEILEVGEEVDKVTAQVGDRIAALSALKGGFAQQCVLDVGDIWRLPSKVKLKAAAVMIYGHSNAIYTFSHLAKLNEKSTIVISVGPGGLGLAAVDVAANIFKVKPFGVCDSESLTTLVRDRGAFRTALFGSKNLKKDLDIETGADVVYDAVGGRTQDSLNTCIKNEGHVFYAAPFHPATQLSPPLNTMFTLVNIEGLRSTNQLYYRQIVQDTLDMADQSLISAHISSKFELKNVNDAIKFIEDKKCTGKVVIRMND